MRRLVTTSLLASWIGFLAVGTAATSIALLASADSTFPRPDMLDARVATLMDTVLVGGEAAIVSLTAAAIFSAIIASFLGLVIWRLQSTDPASVDAGERVGFGALAATGLMVVGVRVGGLGAYDDVASPSTLCIALLLTAVALRLDRSLDTEPAEADPDEAFRAGVACLAPEVARSALRMPPIVGRNHRETSE